MNEMPAVRNRDIVYGTPCTFPLWDWNPLLYDQVGRRAELRNLEPDIRTGK